MERRQVLRLVALTALSQKLHALPDDLTTHMRASPLPGDVPYTLQFFTDEENHLMDELMERIIPADDHSPGAHGAACSLIADLLVSTSNEETKGQWREGLRIMSEAAGRSSLDEALRAAAAHEEKPETEAERFFVALKAMTVNAYYTSEIGIHQELEYAGNKYLGAFPGCSHEGHQA